VIVNRRAKLSCIGGQIPCQFTIGGTSDEAGTLDFIEKPFDGELIFERTKLAVAQIADNKNRSRIVETAQNAGLPTRHLSTLRGNPSRPFDGKNADEKSIATRSP
jgi:hypothetical protein